LSWDHKTIIKGTRELKAGIDCLDHFSGRGWHRIEKKLPNLLEDIKQLVNPVRQSDPTFRTTELYSLLTAPEVRRHLINEKNYTDEMLPTVRTIVNKLNELDFRLKKVNKCKPRIAEAEQIFAHVHAANKIADETQEVIRLSIDTKTNVGPFSRGGYCRQKVEACDHDFQLDVVLEPFGIFLPELNENYFYFTDSNVTADFMADALQDLWPIIKTRFDPHTMAINTIAINADNGPENNSRRTQFMKRMVDFALENQVGFSLIYYPPYHSKYNPIERIWAVLENHWRGLLLNSVEKALGLARSIKWNGKHPVVKSINGTYEKGVKLTQNAMKKIETTIKRISGIEKWAVDILCD
jgi:hypothetical protein